MLLTGYVLLLIIKWGYGSSTVTINFENKEACTAVLEVLKTTPEFKDRIAYFGYCAAKG